MEEDSLYWRRHYNQLLVDVQFASGEKIEVDYRVARELASLAARVESTIMAVSELEKKSETIEKNIQTGTYTEIEENHLQLEQYLTFLKGLLTDILTRNDLSPEEKENLQDTLNRLKFSLEDSPPPILYEYDSSDKDLKQLKVELHDSLKHLKRLGHYVNEATGHTVHIPNDLLDSCINLVDQHERVDDFLNEALSQAEDVDATETDFNQAAIKKRLLIKQAWQYVKPEHDPQRLQRLLRRRIEQSENATNTQN